MDITVYLHKLWLNGPVCLLSEFIRGYFFLPQIVFPLSSSVQSLSSSHAIWLCCLCNPLDTHTHILTHTFSLNVGQLSMSAAEGLALKLDFHISPHLTQSTLSCQVKVSTNVLTHRRIGYRFIPPHSDEMRMWDEICVLLDWWFT